MHAVCRGRRHPLHKENHWESCLWVQPQKIDGRSKDLALQPYESRRPRTRSSPPPHRNPSCSQPSLTTAPNVTSAAICARRTLKPKLLDWLIWEWLNWRISSHIISTAGVRCNGWVDALWQKPSMTLLWRALTMQQSACRIMRQRTNCLIQQPGAGFYLLIFQRVFYCWVLPGWNVFDKHCIDLPTPFCAAWQGSEFYCLRREHTHKTNLEEEEDVSYFFAQDKTCGTVGHSASHLAHVVSHWVGWLIMICVPHFQPWSPTFRSLEGTFLEWLEDKTDTFLEWIEDN